MTALEYFYNESEPNIKLDRSDLNHFALHMKRRMYPKDQGKDLVSELKTFARNIERVKFDCDTNELIPKFAKFLKEVYPSDQYYAGFQIRGFKETLNLFSGSKKKCIVVSAPTSSGKSKVFTAPAIFEVIDRGERTILVYPRLSLMEDQFSNILEIWSRLNGKKFSIGVQRGGIGASDFITIRYGTSGESSFLESKTINEFQGVSIRNVKCPICNSTIWAPTAPVGMEQKEIGKFKCLSDRCRFKDVDIFVSKEKIIKKKPNLLITTVDSLNALLFKQEFSQYIEGCKLIVFDEAHSYESINGAHAANLIKRLRSLNHGLNVFLASATIPNPVDFACKLTGYRPKEIQLIEPNNIELLPSGQEDYRILRLSDGRVGTSSILIQLLLMLSHSVSINTTPSREKILSFLDSRDLVNRIFFDFIDADREKKLSNFRIEKEAYISTDKYKCPVNTEKRCNRQLCSSPGNPYYQGECWYGLTRSYFGTNIKPKISQIKIARVMSSLSESIKDVDLILSTSSMELGVDDRSINTVIQYKAPPSIYSFIQRKGRGGRDRNNNLTNIWLITGTESTDRFYYNNLDSMLSQPYHIPLNPHNLYAVWVSDVLKFAYERLQEEISGMLSGGEANEDDYSLEFSAAYKVAEKYFFSESFKRKLGQLDINSSGLTTKRKKDVFKGSLDDERTRNLSSLKVLTKSNDDIFDSIAQRCYITSNAEKCEEYIKTLQELLKSNKIEAYKDAYLQLSTLFLKAQFSHENSAEAKKVLELLNSVPDLLKMKEAIKRNRIIVYENKAFTEFKNSLDYSDPYYALLHMIRASFYWIQGYLEDASSVKFPGGIKYLMPLNFFSVGDTISLDVESEDYGNTNFHDFIFRYLPHRLSYYSVPDRNQRTRLTLRYLVYSKSYDDSNKVTVLNVGTEKASGVERVYTNNAGTATFIETTRLSLSEVDTSSETEEVKFCGYCYNVFGDEAEKCSYHNFKLETGTLSSRGVYRYVLGDVVESPQKEIYGLVKKYYNLYLLLEGEDLSVRLKDYKKRYVKINFEEPFGKEIAQIPVIEIKVKPLSINSNERLKNIYLSKGKEGFFWEDYLHSVAHLFVKLVSFISGVNTEYITYHIDPENSFVRIFELSETDTGVVDSFLDSISSDPYNLMELIKKLSECTTHETDVQLDKASTMDGNNPLLNRVKGRKQNLDALKITDEAIHTTIATYLEWLKNPQLDKFKSLNKVKRLDNIISCVDGCPDCVHLNNCHDKQVQETSVSRTAVEIYVSTLFKEMSISEFENGNYAEKLAHRDGLIYDRREDNIVWFEF